MSDEKTRKKT